MSPTKGLIDTNAIILSEQLDPIDDLPAEPYISAVTLAELSVGPLEATTRTERAARQARLQLIESMFDPLPFDTAAARAYAHVASNLRSVGRKASARAFDAMIAATAISNGLALYTCNPRDFRGIDGLDLRPINHPDS